MNQELRDKIVDTISYGEIGFTAIELRSLSSLRKYSLDEISEVLDTDTENFRLFKEMNELKNLEGPNRQYSRVGSAKLIDMEKYACLTCGVKHVKLWRMAYDIDPFCEKCLSKDGPLERYHAHLGGHYIPAVPSPSNESMWGFTSVPHDCCTWWNDLPDHK